MLALQKIFQIDYYSSAKMNFYLQQNKSYIYSAIIKYGLKNFSIEILEYCEPDKLLIREKYYIDLGSEYNIIQNPTVPPMSGRNHSDESKTKISDAKKGKPRTEGAGKLSQKIEVVDKNTNEITVYSSICETARALNISHTIIVKYFTNNQKKPYKGRYTFTKI
ncbi:hypothetical protein HOY82DRAFT_641441 [Tuber indicum]|nr:hypothetical protein HOY82DRAFT_641441 [Tuber indicum]